MSKNDFYIMSEDLEKAVKYGHKAVVSRIIEQLDHINYCDFGTETSLVMWASAWGWTDLVTTLIDRGASFKSYCAMDGETALMTAAYHGRIDVVEVLLDRGAKVNQKDISGQTASRSAVLSQNWKILKTLMDKGGKYTSIIFTDTDLDWEQVVPKDPDIPES